MTTTPKPKRRSIHRARKLDTTAVLTVIRVVVGVCQVPASCLIQKTPGLLAVNHARHLAIHFLYTCVPGIVHDQIAEIFHRHISGVTKSTERHHLLLGTDAQYRRHHKQIRALLAP